MELKKTDPRNVIRMELAKFLLNKHISLKTMRIVADQWMWLTDEQAEEKAAEILSYLKDCKNEEEILEKLCANGIECNENLSSTKLKKENTISPTRIELSKVLLEKKWSMDTAKKIVHLLKGLTDEYAEAKAKEILATLKTCNCEADALEKLCGNDLSCFDMQESSGRDQESSGRDQESSKTPIHIKLIKTLHDLEFPLKKIEHIESLFEGLTEEQEEYFATECFIILHESKMIKKNPSNRKRLELLDRLMELNVSTSDKFSVGSVLGNMLEERAEEEANYILFKISSCKNEEEAVEKLF